MASAGTETRRGLLPALRARRDERRVAVPAPRDGGDDRTSPSSEPLRAGLVGPRAHGAAAGPAGRAAPPAATDAFHERWETALAELELEVEATEDLLAQLHEQSDAPALPRRPWTPPVGLGPLPAPLADRARALAERQTRTAEALGRAIVLNRRQARAVDALTDARQSSRGGEQALYLDVAL